MSDQRFYSKLPEFIDILTEYQNKLETLCQNQEKSGKYFQDIFKKLNKLIISHVQLDFDPGTFIESQKNIAIDKKNGNQMSIHQKIQNIRQMFYSNEQIRNKNFVVLHSIDTNKEIAKYAKNVSKKIHCDDIDKALPLNKIVDEQMRPIYSSYLHLFAPQYFPSYHKPINSFYIAKLLPHLLQGNYSCSMIALETELQNTKKVVDDLLEYSVRAKTEYQLFEIARKFPPMKVITSNPIYLEKKELLNAIQKPFNEGIDNFSKGLTPLSKQTLHTAAVLQDLIKKMEDAREKTCLVHSQYNSIISSYEVMNYFKNAFDNQNWQSDSTNNIPFGSFLTLFEPFKEWNDLNESLSNFLLSEQNMTLKDLDNYITKLNLFYEKVRDPYASLESMKSLRKNEYDKALNELNMMPKFNNNSVYINRETIDQAFKENMNRLKYLDKMHQKMSSLLCNLSRICDTRPIMECIDIATKSDDSEIKQRMKEIQYLKALVQERKEEKNELKKRISQIQNEQNESKSEKRSRDQYIAGIDEKYTEARLFVDCMNCDSLSAFMLKPCKHRVCQKCYEKIKKQKTKFCPICNSSIEDYIKIIW